MLHLQKLLDDVTIGEESLEENEDGSDHNFLVHMIPYATFFLLFISPPFITTEVNVEIAQIKLY